MAKLFEIATNVSTPIALAGLVVMVLYAVVRQMLKAGLFPQLDKSAGGRAVNMILKGLFILSIIAMVLGFAGYIVSLYAPPRAAQNGATKDDVAALSKKLDDVVAAMKSTDQLTRAGAEKLLASSGEGPAPDELVAANRLLKQQLAEANSIIESLHANAVTPPQDATAAIESAKSTIKFAANAVGMVSVSTGLALQLIKPQTAARISTILGTVPLDDLEIASWSYRIRMTRRETSSWHYVDIPVGASGYDAARDCADTCIVAAIERTRTELADTHRSNEQRAESLKMLVGLMSDLHRPLHCATRNDDKGANLVKVTLNGKERRLHEVWDADVFRADLAGKDATKFVENLVSEATPQVRAREAAGSVSDWAWQSHEIATTQIYAEVPETKDSVPLPADYLSRHAAIVHQQLLRAGIRLAAVLDAALGS